MKRIARAAALVIVAAVSLAGCFRYTIDMTIDSNNTATGSVVVAVKEGTGAALGLDSDEQAIREILDGETFGDGFVGSEYAEDGFIGERYTFTELPLEALGDFGGLFSISREGDDFVVSGGEPPALSTDFAEAGPDAAWTVAITFPAEVTEHNGSLNGTTVTWDLITLTEPMQATAHASASSGLPLIGIAGIVLGAAAIVALVVILLLVRRRAATAAAAPVPVVGVQDGRAVQDGAE